MQKFIESLGWKKIAIILIVLSIVFLIFIVISTSGTAQKIKESQEPAPTGQENTGRRGSDGRIAPPDAELKTRVIPSTPYSYTTQVYKGVGYKLDYPLNWEAEKVKGTLVHFAHKTTLLGEQIYPRVTVEVVPISPDSPTIEQLVASLSPLKLSQETFSFHNENAVKLSGVLPFEFQTEDGSLKKVNKTFIFATYNNSIYKITYGYYIDGQEEYYVAILKSMMDSFSFQ